MATIEARVQRVCRGPLVRVVALVSTDSALELVGLVLRTERGRWAIFDTESHSRIGTTRRFRAAVLTALALARHCGECERPIGDATRERGYCLGCAKDEAEANA